MKSFLADVAAIQTAIAEYFVDNPLTDNTRPLADVGHLEVEPETKPPYVILVDVTSVPDYAFQNTEVKAEGLYIVRAITEPSETQSAQTVATEIHDGVYAALHNKRLPMNGLPKGLLVRLGPQEPSQWEDVSSEVRYFHSGRKWTSTTAQ